MAFEPIRSSPSESLSGGRGPSAAIYGEQGTTVRIYNSPVTVAPAGAGKKRYSANVGVQNLLMHPIGDEQAGPAAHNLGIFVFVTMGPTVTGTSSACSPACTVEVVQQHGILAFNAMGQRYWYWPEQLSTAGGTTDTTNLRKTWTFEADTQVTTFQFEVLVSAAWPSPVESRWMVQYGGDSLPNLGTEPGWNRVASGTATTNINNPSVSFIRMTVSGGGSLVYTRADSLGANSNAYIEARYALENSVGLTAPEVSFGLDDRTKFIAMGLSGTQAGFLTGQGSLTFAASVPVTAMSLHIYQLRKFGADSVVLFIDGARALGQAYSAFPAPLTSSPTHGFYFGPLGTGSGTSGGGNFSIWDYVIYEIGATQP
jgi:hypothetical protein